jgi:hypothetical protein
MTSSDAALAASLLGTMSLPTGLTNIQNRSREARAYHTLEPYPTYWFRDWKTEDRGPLPRCLPLARGIVKRGARWLFGKPLELQSAANPVLEQFLRQAWQQNRMSARLVAMAETGALDGGFALKFSYDERAVSPLSIQSLSLTEQVRLYYHPHDCNQLLMARVQYPYFDALDGKTYWYREEWTDHEEVHYVPIPDDTFVIGRPTPDEYDGWQIARGGRRPNPFGLIPITAIRNIETDDLWGAGDLWDLYRVLDRVHLTYHLMDKSNQFDSEINPIFIDARVDESDIDKPLQPGQPLQLQSDNDQNPARVILPEARGSLRPAMMEYARDLRKQVLDAASSVLVDTSEITNRGNLTMAVLQQLYLPLIEITDEKRKCYGENGLCLFLSRVAHGLQNAGVAFGVRASDPATSTVDLVWPAYFDLSEDEKASLTARTQAQESSGYLTQERAVERVAQAEGIGDPEQLLRELRERPSHVRSNRRYDLDRME